MQGLYLKQTNFNLRFRWNSCIAAQLTWMSSSISYNVRWWGRLCDAGHRCCRHWVRDCTARKFAEENFHAVCKPFSFQLNSCSSSKRAGSWFNERNIENIAYGGRLHTPSLSAPVASEEKNAKHSRFEDLQEVTLDM